MALIAPLAVFLLGLLEGATHWSYAAFANGQFSSTIHAVDFAQMLPLLFVAAVCGAFSSQLGLLLVTGFALGDLLIAGPAFGHGRPADWTLTHLYVPQLISYLTFFLLAVTPALTAKAMAASLPRWMRKPIAGYPAVESLTTCAVQGISVYAWTLAAPMIVRVHWLWPGETPPLAVIDYIAVLNPWLPWTAAVAMAIRIGLSISTKKKLGQTSIAEARREMLTMDRARTPGPLSPYLTSIGAAFLATVLISGLFDSIVRATWVFGIVAVLFLIRGVVLPKLESWQWWSEWVSQAPLIVRWVATVVAAFVVTRGILFVPSLSARVNLAPGAFGAEIFCFLLSLVISFVLLPQPAKTGSRKLSNTARWGGKLAVLLTVFFLATQPVYAEICLDPFCCFGANSLLAALVIAGLLLLLAPLLFDLIGLGLLAEIGEGAALGGRLFQAGKWFQYMFDTPLGRVGFGATIEISGETLTLSEASIFPTAVDSLPVGSRQVLECLHVLEDFAREDGFKKLIITGFRISGANPGVVQTITRLL